MILNCTPPSVAMIRMILPLQFPGLKASLVDITNWITTNKLKLNTDKTELLILHSKFRLSPQLPSIKIGTDTIEPTNKAHNSRVIFDNTVTMSFLCTHS